MLKTIGFDLGSPLSYRFLRRYSRVGRFCKYHKIHSHFQVCNACIETLTLARYILETSLMYFNFCMVSESLIAAASLLLALRMRSAGHWVRCSTRTDQT